jgi:DNA-directed RNA polymerase subunit RPC12/RpoP
VTVRPRTDRPYIACDSCGHLWTVWNEPTACDVCGSKALWMFPTRDRAVERSRLVRGRR